MFNIEWYYWIIMSFSALGGISAFANFRLQRKWYKESMKGKDNERS